MVQGGNTVVAQGGTWLLHKGGDGCGTRGNIVVAWLHRYDNTLYPFYLPVIAMLIPEIISN